MDDGRALGGAEVVVVGAGVLGACAAYRLAQAGARVTVLDSAPFSGASANSFCWLNGFGKHPRSYYRLNISAIREHKELADELGGTWVRTPGGLHWAASGRAGFTSDLEQTVRQLRSWGARVEAYAPDEVRRIEPGLRLGPDVPVVYRLLEEGWLHPAPLVGAALERAARDYGLRHVVGEVAGFEAGGGVRLSSGQRIGADLAVLAAGVRTPELAALAGGSAPMATSPGSMVVTTPVPAPLRHVLLGPDLCVRPDGAGRLRVSSEALLGRRVESVDDPDVREVMTALGRALPAASGAEVERVLHGTRPLPPDGYPALGFDPDVPWLYYLYTHSGITLAAALAVMLVEHLTDPQSTAVRPYLVDRFAADRPQVVGPGAE